MQGRKLDSRFLVHRRKWCHHRMYFVKSNENVDCQEEENRFYDNTVDGCKNSNEVIYSVCSLLLDETQLTRKENFPQRN